MKMQLLGQFRLSEGDRFLSEEQLRSRRLTNLLTYLLLYRDKILPQQKLIEVVLENAARNPENTLRNLVYRLRTELKAFGSEEYILTLPGAYQWNPEIQVESDYERYDELEVQLHMMTLEGQPETKDAIYRRRTLCREIIECYNGNISEKIAGEIWMLSRVARYQRLYLGAVKCLCEIYEAEENWQMQERLCAKVLSEDVVDEDIYCRLILSLYRQRKTDEALRCYDNAKKIFFEQFGIRELRKLQDVFRVMVSENQRDIRDFNTMQKDMREKAVPRGTFFCEYQVFREIYRIEARRLARVKIREYIMFITLQRTDGVWKNSLRDSGLISKMEELEEIILERLRAGDVATRVSSTQVMVLLTDCGYEDGLRIVERVRKEFEKKNQNRQMELLFELEEVLPNGRGTA